ncbi:MAG: right-handed parallel beta-helix repeat-containing protein [Armatimonadetes bacterium]|nr:right-handed parallel beta-helix repeat-containing protein [Armatimonadota bacterium]
MSRWNAISLILLTPLLAADYTVAPAGADTNPGTADQPFRTVQNAADLLQPGDTCTLFAGTYRETVRPKNSGVTDKPITFRAAPGQTVTLSGADPLGAAWQPHAGRIFRAATDRRFIQLFVDGRMRLEARWPNSPHDDLMAMQREPAGEGTDYDQLCDPKLPPGDWSGALCLLWPGERWSNFTRRVLNYQPGRSFRFDRTFKPDKADPYHTSDPTKPRAGNPYVLFGCLAALDSPGEWFLDEPSGTLYLMPPGAEPAQHRIEVKQRDLAFDLHGLGGIELHGLRIFAAAINMTDAHDCLVEDCRLRYPDHFREMDGYRVPATHNVVTGRNNEWRHCSIAYSASTAILLAGQDNRLVNSVVHDGDYLGTYQGTVDLRNAVGNAVLGCTVCRGGRDLIQHHGAKRIRIEHCDLFLACMLNNDSGATYAWGTDGEGSVIAWNWVHDNQGDSTNGIYLDNFDRNFIVHHNLVWNNQSCGIVLNSDSLDNLVANNTLLGNACTFGTFTYHDRVSTQKGTRVVNNLVLGRMRVDDPSTFVQGELAPLVEHNAMAAIDADAVPTADSAAVDAGVPIPGITDGFQGKAPDLGCYERGGERWTAGADWQDDPPLPVLPRALAFRPAPPVDAEQRPGRSGWSRTGWRASRSCAATAPAGCSWARCAWSRAATRCSW